eukprot:CAMPEP_0194250948 /NCGR_PEP_ID=MMETSP0158-20130606/24209_1 /TAXON_ID=33649 /ORGANISM="Thalassionema nitzschioides, Strain L26-B" /LENGTH=1255 /DNA_ID=CAMNT_0038987905 /DNA_START=109 /DNA_END=3873 /DNA_ORIENTATION=+
MLDDDNLTPHTSYRSSGRSYLQERLDMPMGERPSATVIRRSKREKSNLKISEDDKSEKHPSSPETETKRIVGEIVERPLRKSEDDLKQHRTTRPKSRFSQHRKGKLCQPSGFPSTQVPLGALSRKNAKLLSTSSERNQSIPLAKEITSHDPENDRVSSISDAGRMLSQMSIQEITEQKQELEEALSPETLEFLRNRGQGRKEASKQSMIKPNYTDVSVKRPTDDREEKERLANIVSSIRTIEDLDEAYEKEIGPRKSETGLEGKNDWDKACSLLRSTAPRQTLWAVRVICVDLERDWNKGRHFPSNAESLDWPYPILLPVSLRCLLDSPVAHTNGLLLHVYTLRALYALLKLRAPTEHVIDFGKEALESPQLLYQDVFLDDALPTPPYGSLYPPADTTTVMSNDAGDAIAYTTSSVSAQKDGEAFLNDPLWALMSKMRIIPRLAQLLESRHELPVEGLVAMSGILSMLSVRSAGSASAIARHSTLLPSLLHQTVMPPTNERTTSHFLEPTITFPIMLLLNNMARQSKYVASQIPYIDFLLPLLGIDATGSKHLLQVQKWALIFWRKLLRYGLGLSGLSSLVPLSIQHISTESKLATAYCTLFAAWLDCVKVFEKAKTIETFKSSLQENELKILSSTLTWLWPSIRQCVNSLGKKCVHFDYTALSLEASKMRLVSSFLAASTASNTMNEDFDNLFVVLAERMFGIAKSMDFDRLLEHFLYKCTKQEIFEDMSTCVFLNELLTLGSVVRSWGAKRGQSEINMILSTLRSKILNNLGVHHARSGAIQSKLALCGNNAWSKQCRFTLLKFLLEEPREQRQNPLLLRSYAINLIGQLRLGDEAKAAILFGSEGLFTEDDTLSSPVANMFMRELCKGRMQLDHSYKLQRGFGITIDELGPFGLISLLSEVEKGPSKDGELLPLGTYWLWQVLSGTLDENIASVSGVNAVCEVLSCALQLLIDLEDDHSKNLNPFDSLCMGGKIYFLMNIFLFPESVFCEKDILSKVSILWEKCMVGLDASFVADFFSACLDHSQLKTNKIRRENRVDPKDEMLLAVMTGTADNSSKTFRAIQDFLSDLCTSYQEFGAQYEEFTIGIRLFLMPQFPYKIRYEVMQRLREVSHLLIVEREFFDKGLMKNALEKVIRENVPPEGEREKQEILDLLTDILRGKQGGKSGDFFFLFAVITLSRELLGVINSGFNGLKNSERRLLVLPDSTAQIILDATSRVMRSKNFRRSGLIDAAMHVCSERSSISSLASEMLLE